jgi:hypothetical protein
MPRRGSHTPTTLKGLQMIRRPRTTAPKDPALAEAQAEFTSEGAPAPGKVATQVPVLPATAGAVSPKKSNTRKGPAPAGRHRW